MGFQGSRGSNLYISKIKDYPLSDNYIFTDELYHSNEEVRNSITDKLKKFILPDIVSVTWKYFPEKIIMTRSNNYLCLSTPIFIPFQNLTFKFNSINNNIPKDYAHDSSLDRGHCVLDEIVSSQINRLQKICDKWLSKDPIKLTTWFYDKKSILKFLCRLGYQDGIIKEGKLVFKYFTEFNKNSFQPVWYLVTSTI